MTISTTVSDSSAPGPEPDDDKNEGLRVQGLCKSYNGKAVVEDVDLAVHRGQVVGLLGPNGAGKTTCFYMITGLIAADKGKIHLDGFDISGLPMYRRARLGLGYLPQEPSIFRSMTVWNNVASIVETTTGHKREISAQTEKLLDDLHIWHVKDQMASSLSGGERRRVEVARALASRPSFMLLDEPFANIDPLAVDDIRSLITYLKTAGLGVLITDHNVRETLEITDQAAIMHKGRVLFKGSSDEVINDPEVRRVYLGDRFSRN